MSDMVTVTGNIGTDPASIPIRSGGFFTSFRLASPQRRWDAQTGRWGESGQTNWYTVSAFRRLGENALTSLRKGDSIIVTGRLQLRAWTSGERTGLSPDLEAIAIGHDLRWGTAVYVRNPRGEDSPDGGAQPDQDAEGWSLPGGGLAEDFAAEEEAKASAGSSDPVPF